jgi:hypothetical protein
MGSPGLIHPSTELMQSSADTKATPRPRKTDPVVLAVILSFTLLLAWRMFSWTNQYAVDLMYQDHWDYYTPLFEHAGIFRLFTWQHGPHRQGVGMLLIAAFASLTNWNLRADAFTVAGAICVATLLALILKRRLFGSISWSDLLIPAILLTMRQWESLVSVPNPSHSAVPLVLLVLYALAWTIASTRLRYTLVLTLNFLTLFTGFGFFLGLVTPALLLIEFIHLSRLHGRRRAAPTAIALVISLLSFASFYIKYTFEPSAPNFRFPDPLFYLYPHMMALLFANGAGFVGTSLLPSIVGWTLMLAALFVLFIHTRALLFADETEPRPTRQIRIVIWILITFSLLFDAGMAVGRISFGVQMATVSRYVTLILPALLGLYFHLLTLRPAPWRTAILIGATAILAIFALHLRTREEISMLTYRNTKNRWREVYRQTDDIAIASRAVGTVIHPTPDKTHLKQKLDYLKQHHLSFFND